MVKCEICGKEMKWIQNTHLKRHHITLEEYKKLYPNSPTMTEDMNKEMIRTRKRNHRVPIRVCTREGCGKPVKNWKENKYCSCRCNALDNPKVGLHYKGYASSDSRNPNYKGGDYSSCKSQKQKAYERDNQCCVKCGQLVDGKDSRYGVHHLIPRRLIKDKEVADSLDNLVTLCSKHHSEAESMFAEEIFALYTEGDFKSINDLMMYLRSKL